MSQPLRYTNPADCSRMFNRLADYEAKLARMDPSSADYENMRQYIDNLRKQIPTSFQYIQRPDGQGECQAGNMARDNNGNLLRVYTGQSGCIQCLTDNAGGRSGPSNRDDSGRGNVGEGKIVDAPKSKGVVQSFNNLKPLTKAGLGIGLLALIGLIVFLMTRKRRSVLSFRYCGMEH